jgi:tight adherence protein B
VPADFADPDVALALMGGVLLIALAGVAVVVSAWSRQESVAQRSALEAAEQRSQRLRNRLDARLRKTRVGVEIETRLVAAGVELTVVEFLAVSLAAAAAGYAISNFVFPTWLAVGAGIACAYACWHWVERKRAKRRDEFIQQLPEVARILSNASSAGLAISTAIEMAAAELDDPAGEEMSRVSQELHIGQSLVRALHNLEHRLPSREVGVLISTLVIQQRSGGDLVRALSDMANTLESRRDLRREVRTLMAGSVFTGYVVALLGIGSLLVLNFISEDLIEKMTETGVGRIALIVSGVLYVVGFLLVEKVTRIET